jgi:cell division protein FtsI/penicillin-binding protein 2
VEKALTLVNDSLRDDMPHDLKLTLDLRLQRDAMSALGGKIGAIVVMDASNGEVLAAANYPTYDPDSIASNTAWARYVRDTVRRPLTSRAIKDNFSPGSSIKPFIAAAALHLGTPLPESRGFVCTGSYVPVPNTKPITEHGSAHGGVDIKRAMRYSCNIYFSYLAYGLLGFDAAKDYLDSIGFDQRLEWNSGAFFNEFSTLLPAKSWVKGRDEIAKSRLGIGQASVKTNPVHMAAMVAGIANHGIFYRPTLEMGRRPDTLRWFFDRAETATLEDLLREPLLPGGTAAGAFGGFDRRGITVYGKTGTADREPDGREPSWFISYGRKNGRTFVVVVAIQDRRGEFAGTLNAPMARRMFEALDGYGYFGKKV